MTSQTNHHPSTEELKQYTEGLLSTGMSVAISAHLELCECCRDKTAQFSQVLAQDWIESGDCTEFPSFDQFNQVLDEITSEPQLEPEMNVVGGCEHSALHMHERSVALPTVLAKVANKGLVWKRLAGGINTASLGIDRETQCDFMYMKPGSQAPRHKHQGMEITLVLDGTFHDELGQYGPGDFILRRGNDTHTPQSDDGCLCFTVLDSPLTFTSGVSRLLNPFQRMLFNRQLRQSLAS